ncbi:MAG: hypothetical protein KJO38_11145, partial [Gammaproteobacteria bacterium]|nr:hypothetical protein [Gammaproteobacteria bacterium]
AVPSVVTRNSVVLQQQSILSEPTQTFGTNTETVRILSNNDVNYAALNGWYLDLVSPAPVGAQGERLIADPVIFGDIVLFNTFISSNDCAQGGGTSPLMALDAVNGGEPPFTVFDLDQDAEFDTGDQVGGADTDGDGVPDSYANPAGKIGARSVAPVTLVGMQQDGMAIALTTSLENAGAVGGTGGGNIETTVLNDPILTLGRQAWKQLR